MSLIHRVLCLNKAFDDQDEKSLIEKRAQQTVKIFCLVYMASLYSNLRSIIEDSIRERDQDSLIELLRKILDASEDYLTLEVLFSMFERLSPEINGFSTLCWLDLCTMNATYLLKKSVFVIEKEIEEEEEEKEENQENIDEIKENTSIRITHSTMASQIKASIRQILCNAGMENTISVDQSSGVDGHNETLLADFVLKVSFICAFSQLVG